MVNMYLVCHPKCELMVKHVVPALFGYQGFFWNSLNMGNSASSGMHLSGLSEEPADLPTVHWIENATHDAKVDSRFLASMQMEFVAKIRIRTDTM